MAQASGSGGGETVALAIAAAGAAGVGWYLEQGNRVLGVPIPEFPFGIGKARYEQNLATRANVAIPESSPVSSTTVASTTSTAPATKATTSTSTPTHASRKTHVAQKTTPSPRISQVGVAPGTQNYRLTTAMTAAQVARAYGITAQELAALQTSASKRDLILQHPNELLAKGNVLVTPRPKKRVS